MSATCATWRHQSAASPPVYGSELTSRKGLAPFAARARTSSSTFARYCAFVGDHGVVVPAPFSSLSAISGVVQPDRVAAFSKSVWARPSIVLGSAGAVVVPTVTPSLFSQ
jgi:hypothetical protein